MKAEDQVLFLIISLAAFTWLSFEMAGELISLI